MIRVPLPTWNPNVSHSPQAFLQSMLKGIVFSFLSFLAFPLHAWGCFAFFALHPFGIGTLLVLSQSLLTCCSRAYASMSHDKGVRGREGVRWGRGRGREWGWEGGK